MEMAIREDDAGFAVGALNEALRASYHSLARYALAADPYATGADIKVVEALEGAAAEDEDLARRLAEAIEAAGGIPEPGLPGEAVGAIAYLSARRLARMCLEQAEAQSLGLARTLKGFPAELNTALLREAKRLLEEVLEASHRQCAALRAALQS